MHYLTCTILVDVLYISTLNSMGYFITLSYSAFPLMRESLGVLMQRTPIELHFTLGHHLQKSKVTKSLINLLLPSY